MKKVITILIATACSMAFGYHDLLDMVSLVKDVKNQKEMATMRQSVEEYKATENFADLKLWHLECTQPKIFIDIETADNATDIGYLRIDYRKAGNIGKLGLLKEYFNIK